MSAESIGESELDRRGCANVILGCVAGRCTSFGQPGSVDYTSVGPTFV